MARYLTVRKKLMKPLLASLLALLLSASGPSCGVYAQGAGCTDSCKAAFGACYKSTANRGACEMHLQRCLEGCLMSKRG